MISLLSSRSFLLRTLAGVMLAVAMLLAAPFPVAAQDGGLRYTFAPVGGYLYESDNSALRSEFVYGGELGLGFGRYLQVSGEYLLSNSVTTNLSAFDELAGLQERTVDLRRYGGRLRVNLNDRGYIPYLSAGTGILEFNPNQAETTESIYATVGGGVTFQLAGRYRVSLGGELLSYRYEPVSTFVGQDVGTEIGEQTVYSPSLRASVEFFLGGRSLDEPTAVDEAFREQFGSGLSNIRLTVDPFYGRLQFNDALGFPKDQNLYGVNAGVDLGPYIGLRGFYWRGTTGDEVLDDLAGGFEDLQLYGGELKLRFAPKRARTIAPYGLIGGGYLDALGGYDDDIPSGTAVPGDRFFATGGAGLEVPLTSSLMLVGDVRSLLMSGLDAADVSSPSEVYGSLMYSVGVEFNLGGGRDRSRRPVAEAPAPDRAAPSDATMRQQELLARIDSLERALQRERLATDTTQVLTGAVPPDSVVVRAQPAEQPAQARPGQAARASNLSDKTIMLPVPEVGEIYVRFGEVSGATAAQGQTLDDVVTSLQRGQQPAGSAGLTAQEVQQIVREALREQMRTARPDTAGALTQQQIEQTVRRTLREYVREGDEVNVTTQSELQRLEEQIESLRQQVQRQTGQPAERTQTRIVESGTQAGEQPFYRAFLGRPLTAVLPSVNVRGGEGPTQVLVGVRGDYRSRPNARFRMLPEVTLGFGNGPTSISALGNVSYTLLRAFAERNTGLPLEPYVGTGLGIASPTGLDLEFVGNLMLGVDYRPAGRGTFFVEYSTLDLFDYNRFGVGYRVRL